MSTELHKKDFAALVQALLEDLGKSPGGRTPLTDATDGSVVRTLVEAFSRELAVAYAQLDQVYQLGYVGTATGHALDQVVELVGVARRRRGHLEGTVMFSRREPAPAAVPIAAGTPVAPAPRSKAAEDGVTFETTANADIAPGATEVTVAVRSVAPSETKVPVGVLVVMSKPIFGVDAVTNRTELVPRSAEESDDELRERGRARVGAANLGTVAAITRAIRGLGLETVDVQEPSDRPGVIEVTIGDAAYGDKTLGLSTRVADVLEETRPAGIFVDVKEVRWVRLCVTATLVLDRVYSPGEREKIRKELEGAVGKYVQSLGIGESVREAKVRNALAGHERVRNLDSARILTAYGTAAGGQGDPQREIGPDILIVVGERATVAPLDAAHPPFKLSLQDPSPLVYVDVSIQLKATPPAAVNAITAITADQYREALAPSIERAAKGSLAYDVLINVLSQPLSAAASSIRFTVTHTADGRVVELNAIGNVEPLAPLEHPKLRDVTVFRGGTS